MNTPEEEIDFMVDPEKSFSCLRKLRHRIEIRKVYADKRKGFAGLPTDKSLKLGWKIDRINVAINNKYGENNVYR